MSKRVKTVYHQERQFVDVDNSGVAALSTTVVRQDSVVWGEDGGSGKPRPWLNVELVLTSCNHRVEWGYDGSKREDHQRALERADAILAQMQAFRQALFLAVQEFPVDEAPDAGCVTTPDGGCVSGTDCMHGPPCASENTVVVSPPALQPIIVDEEGG